jgi:hypothetical protein
MLYPLQNLANVGIIKDSFPEALNQKALTDGKNVRFVDGAIESITGYTQLYPVHLGVQFLDQVYWAVSPIYNAKRYFVLAGIKDGKPKAFVCDYAGTFEEVTPSQWLSAPLSVSIGRPSGGVFDGIPVFCSGRSAQIFYLPPPFFGQKFTELQYNENFSLSRRLKFNVVRPLWQQLFGLGVEVTAREVDGIPEGYYPRLLWFSDFADPGNIPGSWEASDPTTAARSFPDPFAGFDGRLVDAAMMGNFAVIYQEDACHLMTYTGVAPNFVTIEPALFEVGALTTGCVTPFQNQHFVLTNFDVVVHNTQQVQSVVESRLRDWLFAQMDAENAKNCFTTANYSEKELMVCFPEKGERYPNLALVWNYQNNTLTIRDIPQASTTAISVKANFQEVAGEIKEDTVILAGAKKGRLLVELDGSYQQLGERQECFIEKTGIKFDGDSFTRKLVTRLWPEVDTEEDQVVEFYIGAQDRVDDNISWQGPFRFIPQREASLPVLAQGRVFSLRLTWCGNRKVRVNQVVFEYEPAGRY